MVVANGRGQRGDGVSVRKSSCYIGYADCYAKSQKILRIVFTPCSRPGGLAGAVRGHWSIEYNLHWVLDVAFQEDASRVRKDHGPENLGLVRRIALSLLKRAPTKKKVGMACKRKQAGWNDDFLVQVLLGKAA